MNVQVFFMGVDLKVEGRYEPEQVQTYDDPGFDEKFEIEEVRSLHGDDLSGIFDLEFYNKNSSIKRSLYGKLEDACLEQFKLDYREEFGIDEDSYPLSIAIRGER